MLVNDTEEAQWFPHFAVHSSIDQRGTFFLCCIFFFVSLSWPRIVSVLGQYHVRCSRRESRWDAPLDTWLPCRAAWVFTVLPVALKKWCDVDPCLLLLRMVSGAQHARAR